MSVDVEGVVALVRAFKLEGGPREVIVNCCLTMNDGVLSGLLNEVSVCVGV